MTTVPQSIIAPDSALIIDPEDFGGSATGVQLERLFVEFTRRHSQSAWQFELSPEGKIIVMAPTYYPSSFQENAASSILFAWSVEFGGVATGPTGAYRLPVTGGIVAPDAAWTSADRWASHDQMVGEPIALCPDFVIEVRSGSDNVTPLHAKMRLYLENGALLGWLIDPPNRQVSVYRTGHANPEFLENPATLLGEGVLPGFVFDVARWIFEQG